MRGIEVDQSGPKQEGQNRRGLAWALIPYHTWLETLQCSSVLGLIFNIRHIKLHHTCDINC